MYAYRKFSPCDYRTFAMKIFRSNLCQCDRQQRRMFLIFCVTIFNFGVGLYLISSFTQQTENELTTKKIVMQPKETKSMQTQIPKTSTVSKQRSLKQYYQNYFRIDYTIVESVCKPKHMFNTSATIQSLEYLTNLKFNMIPRNVTINIDIISIDVIITKTTKTQQ
ncbi:unnamed protein product, partial [Rotaria sp. Silwood2]